MDFAEQCHIKCEAKQSLWCHIKQQWYYVKITPIAWY